MVRRNVGVPEHRRNAGSLGSGSACSVGRSRRSFEVCLGELYYRNAADVLLRCVLPNDQMAVIQEAHSGVAGGHFAGPLTAKKIIQSGLWWPTLHADVHNFVWNCDAFQRMGQPSASSRLPLHPVLPLEPFQKWGLDFIGPIKPAAVQSGNRYILTTTDDCTKWVEASARSVAKCLFKDMFTRFGCPVELVSDRGGHFINRIIKHLTGFFSVMHKKSSPWGGHS